LAKNAGFTPMQGTRIASLGTAILSVGTILGCLLAPVLAEKFGRKRTLAAYFIGMAVSILLAFGWAFYLPNGLVPFIAVLFFLGLAGGNFAIFSLWLPEQYDTQMRATAFAFCTSFGRFLGAGANFAIAALVGWTGSLGYAVALTAIPFLLGLAVIPFARETRGEALP
jgi:MFS family permease